MIICSLVFHLQIIVCRFNLVAFCINCILFFLFSSTEPYPSAGFCEAYDTLFPTVLLKDWFKGEEYQHLVIHTRDCVLSLDYLKRQPTPVYCHLLGHCLEVVFDQTNSSDYKETYWPCSSENFLYCLMQTMQKIWIAHGTIMYVHSYKSNTVCYHLPLN